MPPDTLPQAEDISSRTSELPKDAHNRTMQLLKTPPEDEQIVAIMAHRGYHDLQSNPSDTDVGEHTRQSLLRAADSNFALVEVDAKFNWLIHGNTWGPFADVGTSQGLPPFNVTDVESDQRRVNPPVEGSTWDDVKDFKLRTPNFVTTDETPMNISTVLKYVADEKLPINMVFDCKTPEDVRDVPPLLANTKHFDGAPFIDTAMVKIRLNSMKTVEEYDKAFAAPGPDGKPIGDRLNVIWVVTPNDVEEFGSEQAIIDSLEKHRATGRFSMTELNIKDDKGLHQVAQYVRESNQPWLGSYHPVREADLVQTDDDPLAKGDWNNITDKETLHRLGEEKVLFLPNGTCCHSINSDLYGSEYDQRPSLARLEQLGINFITTDTPVVARDFFEAKGTRDISSVVMAQAQAEASSPNTPGLADSIPRGWSSYAPAGGVLLVGIGALLAMRHRAVKSVIQKALGAVARRVAREPDQEAQRGRQGSGEEGFPLMARGPQQQASSRDSSQSATSDTGRPPQESSDRTFLPPEASAKRKGLRH